MYLVPATFSKLIDHSVESKDSLEQAASVRFSISGVEAQLPVYYYPANLMAGLQNASEKTLIMPFGDLTNGQETPTSGRYIILPVISDTFYIDFNQALLWPCMYSDHDPCPPLKDAGKINAFIRAGQRN